MKSIKNKAVSIVLIIGIILSVAVQFPVSGMWAKVFASDAATELTPDPYYQMLAFDSSSSMKIMSDGNVHGTLLPTEGFGGRANLNGLNEQSRFSVEDDIIVELNNLELQAEATFTVALQTLSTGTIGLGNGGGVHVAFRIMKELGKYMFALIVWNNSTSVTWAPTDVMRELDPENPVWRAEKVTITFNKNNAVSISWENATTPDYSNTLSEKISGFENLFQDLKDDTVDPAKNIYHSTKPYLSFSCFNVNLGQKKGVVNFDLAAINGVKPLDKYKSDLNTRVEEFTDAVNNIKDDNDTENIQKAANLNNFGETEIFGILLNEIGTETQKAAVDEAINKLQSFNGANVYNELKKQIEDFITSLGNFNENDSTTVKAAVEKYEQIDWGIYNILNDFYKTQADEMIANMTADENFGNAVFAFADQTVGKWEQAASAEFDSSDGYNNVKANCDDWNEFKSDNYITADYMGQDKITALDSRIDAIEEKLEDSVYNNYLYIGTGSQLKIYKDVGLYMNLTPDVYPANNNALGFKEKMTLNEDSEISFNLIYALRKLGAFQMQIGFYPVAGARSKGEHDGVRVDFWTSAAGSTEIQPVNGKTELPAFTGAYLSLTDEDFFDINAETLDYTKSDYTVKLASNPDGSLYVSVNGLEIDITDKKLNADLYKDGVYITITGVGVKGTNPYELLVTKLGSVNYREGGNDDDNTTKPEGEGSGCGCGSNIVSGMPFLGFVGLSAAIVFVLKRKSENKHNKS